MTNPSAHSSVVVLAAAEAQPAIAAACSTIRASCALPSVIHLVDSGSSLASSRSQPVAELARQAFQAAGHRVVVLSPPAAFPLRWGSSAKQLGAWTSVALSPLSDALSHATLPARLLAADPLVVINDVRHSTERRPSLALGIWRQFLHPKQRLLVNLAARRLPIDAELGALFRPRGIILLPYWAHGFLVVVSSDRIASELVGLAIHQATRFPALAFAGPWEDPIVQHATDLDLGIRLPADLIIEWRWLGARDSAREADLARLADVVSSRLGVNPPVRHDG